MMERHEDVFCNSEEENVRVGDSIPAIEAEKAANVYSISTEDEAGDDEQLYIRGFDMADEEVLYLHEGNDAQQEPVPGSGGDNEKIKPLRYGWAADVVDQVCDDIRRVGKEYKPAGEECNGPEVNAGGRVELSAEEKGK